MKHKAEKLAFCATAVDNCLFIATNNDELVQQQS